MSESIASDADGLSGRVAIVTGAAGALGQAICEEFRAGGATVVATDIGNGDSGAEMDVSVDIATPEGNRVLVEHAIAKHGRIDTLVLNAGVQHMASIADFPVAEWDRMLAVMLSGPFLAMKYAWPYLTARPGARILATASTSSYVAEPYKAAYVAAKHGLLGLVKVAAHEGASNGLTANAVAPSWMRTPMVEGQLSDRTRLLGIDREKVFQELVGEHAVKRFVELEEVAAALAFLAGSRASGITGTCVPVDLGALA